MSNSFYERLDSLHLGDHVCLLHDNADEQLASVVPFIKLGLERRERCLYITDDQTAEQMKGTLNAAGVQVESQVAKGALSVVTKRDVYLRTGKFDPSQMIQFLGGATELAQADGFSGLRITGEMTWALGPEIGCDRVIEYEAALNAQFSASKALIVCQYNRQRFSPSIIKGVLRRHPVAMLGTLICSNPYYEPPELASGTGNDADRVNWMITQLRAAHETEERLKHQAQELARSNADLRHFAYAASHDLQEPTRNVVTHAQLLARKYGPTLDDEAHDLLGYIVKSAQHMAALVNGILTYSQAARVQQHTRRAVDMNQVMQVVLRNLNHAIGRTGATVTYDALPTLRGNPTQLAQLMQNLVENAIRYRAPDRPPHVHVTAYREAGWAFAVRDNGIGVAPEYHKSIFTIFKRLNRDIPGTGIGLALCQRIAENHHGRVWLESRPGAGSTFHFWLPDV